jgi:hypothetical protein
VLDRVHGKATLCLTLQCSRGAQSLETDGLHGLRRGSRPSGRIGCNYPLAGFDAPAVEVRITGRPGRVLIRHFGTRFHPRDSAVRPTGDFRAENFRLGQQPAVQVHRRSGVLRHCQLVGSFGNGQLKLQQRIPRGSERSNRVHRGSIVRIGRGRFHLLDGKRNLCLERGKVQHKTRR